MLAWNILTASVYIKERKKSWPLHKLCLIYDWLPNRLDLQDCQTFFPLLICLYEWPSDDLLVAASTASFGDPVTGCEQRRTGLEVDRMGSGPVPNESSVESGSGATPAKCGSVCKGRLCCKNPNRIKLQTIKKEGCRHSSVDSSVPNILPPRVRVPSTPSMLLSFIVLCYICHLKRTKINKKRPDLAHF